MKVFLLIKSDLSNILIKPEGGCRPGDTVELAIDDNFIEQITATQELPNMSLNDIPLANRHLALEFERTENESNEVPDKEQLLKRIEELRARQKSTMTPRSWSLELIHRQLVLDILEYLLISDTARKID